MKKSMLYTGIGYVVVGVLCFTIAAVWNPKISALLFGLGGAGVIPGLLMNMFTGRVPKTGKSMRRG